MRAGCSWRGEDCPSPQGEFRSLGRNTPCASFPDVLELRGLMGFPRSERLVRNGSRGQATISRFTPPPSESAGRAQPYAFQSDLLAFSNASQSSGGWPDLSIF